MKKNKQILDTEEIWTMPAQKNETVWCVVAVALFVLMVVTLVVIL